MTIAARIHDPSPDDPSPDAWHLTADAVPEFCERVLLNPERRLPVVCLTTIPATGRSPVDPETVVRVVGDRAIVVVIPTGPATFALVDGLAQGLEIYGGAMRVWRAPLNRDDDRATHPIIWADKNPESTVVERLARELGIAPHRPDGLFTIGSRLRATAPVSRGVRLASAVRNVGRRATKPVTTPPPRADPFASEETFRAAVADSHARRYGGADRTSFPLRPYTLGDGFLASCRRLKGISPGKVVAVCADVVCDRGHRIHVVHPLAVGRGPAGQLVRDDGAKAWRLRLQKRGRSARRLHYWTLGTPEGRTFELTSVSVHDGEI